MKKTLFLIAAVVLIFGNANAQFGGLGKKMLDRAKDKVERKIEQKAERAMDKAINKADEKASDAADKALNKAKDAVKKENSTEETSNEEVKDFGIIEDETPQQDDLQARRAAAREKYGITEGGDRIPSAYKAAFEKVDAALKTLEEAVANGNDQYVWDDPAGNDAKRALNECLEIKNFNREEKHFVEYKQRYFNAKQEAAEKADLLSGRPEMLCHMDRSENKEKRLNDFYTLMNWYIKAADEAKYARQKEYIVANASKDWKAFEKERLMLFNNTTLNSLRKKLDSYRLNIPADKSTRIANKNAVTDVVDLYLLFFSITDYSNNDYSNDANVSPEHKKSMKEAEEYHAQYMREKADVEGLQTIKVTPGGAITCKYGNFTINSFNQIHDSRGNLIAKMVRYQGHYEVYTGPYMSAPRGQVHQKKDGTWVTFYSGGTGGRIEKDGTIYFMDQKITKVDLSQISPEWVCMIYFFKAFE